VLTWPGSWRWALAHVRSELVLLSLENVAPVSPRSLRPASRRRRLVLACIAAAGAAYLAFAYQSIRSAAHDVERARASAVATQSTLSFARVAAGDLAALDDAYASVRRARERLANPLLVPLRIVPLVGRQLASAEALTRSVEAVMRPALRGLHELQHVPATSELGPRVEQYGEWAHQTILLVQRNIAEADFGPSKGLIGPLARARAQLTDSFARLDDGLAKVDAAAQSARSAVAGPRQYLLIGGTNSEMAAGAPIPLARGLLTIRNGELSVGNWSWGEVQGKVRPVAVPPGPLADLWSFVGPGKHFQELNQSPSFELSAPLAAAQYKAATGVEVDGVVMVDTEALVGLSDLTGPVVLGGVERSGAVLRQFVLHDQYIGVGDSGVDNAARHDALLDLTESVFTKLVRSNTDAGLLFDVIARLGAGRHVLFWSTHAGEQETAQIGRVDGSLGDDAVFVGLSNRGANKMDYFTTVAASATRSTLADGLVRVSFAVTVRNDAPATGEPRYVVGPSATHVKVAGDYAGYLSLLAPRGASEATLVGEGPMVVDGYDDGHPVVGRLIRVGAGETWTGTWEFTLPADRTLTPAPSARPTEIVWSGL
jgi:Protein of unknown function (DUF4012)